MVLTPPQDKRPSQARRLTRAALLTAIALTIFLAEAQLPPPVPIPGIKLGLANIVTVYAMFVLGPRDTLLILLSRIFLGAVFSGQMMTLLYSLGGGLLSYLALLLLRRVLGRGQLWVSSPLSAVCHNLGQLLAAAAIAKSWVVLVYLPYLVLAGLITGTLTGLCAQLVVGRLSRTWSPSLLFLSNSLFFFSFFPKTKTPQQRDAAPTYANRHHCSRNSLPPVASMCWTPCRL